jgi:thiol-disulfide isomerase/thioredoxin
MSLPKNVNARIFIQTRIAARAKFRGVFAQNEEEMSSQYSREMSMKKISLFVLCLSLRTLLAAQETTISGVIVGSDGKPMLKSHVHLSRFGATQPLLSVEAAKDGSYKISTGESGLLRIQFTGVDHQLYEVPLFVEKQMKVGLDAQLSRYSYKDSISNPAVIGDFNKFSFGDPRPMERRADGTYAADFETNDTLFRYQLVGLSKDLRSINGTQSEDYEYDGGGDYQSIVTPRNGRVRIVFAPAKLVRSSTPTTCRFAAENGSAKRFADLYAEIQSRHARFLNAANDYRSSGKDMREFKYDWSGELSSIAEKIQEERDSLSRKVMLLSYLDILSMSLHTRDARDSAIARQAIAELTPSSWLWSMSESSLLSALFLGGKSRDNDLMEKFIHENPDVNLKSEVLFNQMVTAKYANDTAKFRYAFRYLAVDYAETQAGKIAKERFSPDTRIQVGKNVPTFTVTLLDDAKTTFSNDAFKGKITLIDFWATWCGPCVGEMESLHKAYDRFGKKNFQILSLSFDVKVQDIQEFRDKKWKMPWLHAFVEKGFNSELAKQFEVIGIPRPVLVDGDGKIIALEEDLRGERLEKTLDRVMAADNQSRGN